jgi:cytoskeletal protein CcmA (bactofilin family)
MKELDFKKQNYTVIGINNSIEGELKLTGDAIIHSSIKGTITMFQEGTLILERNSSFEGTIYCNDIEVFGEVKGTIKANGKLTIRSSASISGNIQAKQMSVYPGAILNIEGHTDDNEEKSSAGPVQ